MSMKTAFAKLLLENPRMAKDVRAFFEKIVDCGKECSLGGGRGEYAIPGDFTPRLINILPREAPYTDPEFVGKLAWCMLTGHILQHYALWDIEGFLSGNPAVVDRYVMDSVELDSLHRHESSREAARALMQEYEARFGRVTERPSKADREFRYSCTVGALPFARKMMLCRNSDGFRLVTIWPLIWPLPPVLPINPEDARKALDKHKRNAQATAWIEAELARQATVQAVGGTDQDKPARRRRTRKPEDR